MTTHNTAHLTDVTFVTQALDVAPRPVFVVGAERSGSTMLRLMLDRHPGLSFPHQLEFMVEHMTDSGEMPDLDTYRELLKDDPVFARSGFRVRSELGDYARVVADFLEQKRGLASIVGGTVHRDFHRLRYLWPNARYIHLLRDPRAVARSCVAMGWDGNLWSAVDRWLDAEVTWERLAEAIPSENTLTVRYESLVRDPRSELERICTFLNVPFDDHMLTFHRTSTYAPISRQFADSWRDLSPFQLSLAEHKLGSWLVRRGYLPTRPPRSAPNALERVRLQVENRVRKAAFRKQRYGLALWASSLLSTRLAPWVDRVNRDVQRVDASHVK